MLKKILSQVLVFAVIVGIGHAPSTIGNQVQARLMAQRAAMLSVRVQIQQQAITGPYTINMSYDDDSRTATATCEY